MIYLQLLEIKDFGYLKTCVYNPAYVFDINC
jgi:hypothetical protein